MLAEQWEEKKRAHIAALYANTNMDMKENNRPEVIKGLERAYDDVIEAIRNNTLGEGKKEEEMTPEEAAFMSAAKRGQARILPPVMPGEETIANLPE